MSLPQAAHDALRKLDLLKPLREHGAAADLIEWWFLSPAVTANIPAGHAAMSRVLAFLRDQEGGLPGCTGAGINATLKQRLIEMEAKYLTATGACGGRAQAGRRSGLATTRCSCHRLPPLPPAPRPAWLQTS